MDQVSIERKDESAIAVGIRHTDWTRADAEAALEELKSLIISAGAHISDTLLCDIDKIRSATFIGTGKIEEIRQKILEKNVTLVVLDDSLSPAQQRNLEDIWGVRVIDRTGMILDIFAHRAKTKEGKLQVELAQLEYRLPRLTRMWEHLSRLGAGIGTRGPGETQLEVDRRRIRQRIVSLKAEIEKIKNRRRLQRKSRQKVGLLSVALVGYTNAGKSTLLNQLTGATVLVMDQLFATLDPTIRLLHLPNNQKVIISDTVGFISKLPHQLVVSFRATLEEVVQSDLILHVINAASSNRDDQIKEVERVLNSLDIEQKPILQIYNKIDLVPEMIPGRLSLKDGGYAVGISALTGSGMDILIDEIMRFQSIRFIEVTFMIPYSNSDIVALIQREGTVKDLNYRDHGVEIVAEVTPGLANKYRIFWKES